MDAGAQSTIDQQNSESIGRISRPPTAATSDVDIDAAMMESVRCEASTVVKLFGQVDHLLLKIGEAGRSACFGP